MEGIHNKCLLCLATGVPVVNVERNVLEKLQFVLLDVKLCVKSFMICQICEEKIGDLYEYKTCLIESLEWLRKEVASNEDSDKYSQKASCHLCEHTNSTMFFSEILKDPVITKVFKTYIPEIKLEMQNDLIICIDCQNCLLKFSSWVNSWSYASKQWANKMPEYQNSEKHLSETQNEIIYDLLQDSVMPNVKPDITLTHESNTGNNHENENLSCNIEPEGVYSSEPAINESDGALDLENVMELKNECIDIKYEILDEDLFKNKLPINHKLTAVLSGSTFNTTDRKILRINLKRLDFEPKNLQIILTKSDTNSPVSDINDLSQYIIKPLYELIHNPYVKNRKSSQNLIQNPVYKCPHCSYKSKSEENFKFHLENHVKSIIPGEMRFKCKKCPYQVQKEQTFKRHMKWHDRNREIYICYNCTYRTPNKTFLIRHMVIHSRNIQALGNNCYQCLICSFKIITLKLMQKHIIAKHENHNMEHKCEECDYATVNKCNFHRHMRVHKKLKSKKLLNCLKCDYNTHDLFNFRKHVRKTHTKAWLKCQVCDFRTHSYQSLYSHVKIHEKTIHYCNVCSYKNKSIHRFEQHMKLHEQKGIPIYTCKKCDFQTENYNNLRKHIVMHNSSNEFTIHNCDICEYKTKFKKNIQRHLANHEKKLKNERHKCEHCSFSTTKQSLLQKHGVIHQTLMEVQFYKCLFCSFISKRKSYMKIHTKTKHPEKLSGN